MEWTKDMINFQFYGYTDSLLKLVPDILGLLRTFPFENEKLFEIQKDKLTKSYKNFFVDEPYFQARTYIEQLTVTGTHEHLDLLQAITNPKLTFKLYCEFVKNWLKNGYLLKWLVTGNLLEKSAVEFVD